MELVQATRTTDWATASKLLQTVANSLASKDIGLWSAEQISIENLQREYNLDQLHFLTTEATLLGLVFLLESDPFFWPEAEDQSSLFFHKLAIYPEHSGQGYGEEALNLIRTHALSRRLQWIRLDCDDRQRLHDFYSNFGFSLVDIRRMDEFMVARYQLRVI